MTSIVAAALLMAVLNTEAPKLDHIMLGAPDLDRAIAAFKTATGVTPVKGGRHPGRGTQNALVSVGNGTYIEIIAPTRETSSDELASMLQKLNGLTPVGWALRVSDAATTRDALAKSGLTVTALQLGGRVTPAGERLAWTTFDVEGFEAAPFFIQWDRETRHPSTTSPGGCTIETFSVADPAGGELLRALRSIGADTVVGVSQKPMINVTLRCGQRIASFSSH
jgi:catechol 2,3-dioxygenase-like lactoylglutathione lyase family enzyme